MFRVLVQRFTIRNTDEYSVTLVQGGEIIEDHTYHISDPNEWQKAYNNALGKCSELCRAHGLPVYSEYPHFVWEPQPGLLVNQER